MAAQQLPYVMAYGNITKVLDKIIDAKTPPRFTVDYLGSALDMTGGSARPLIPFLKRAGFLGTDGVPTDLYNRFRNPDLRGAAAADAMRKGYARLYQSNEYVHKLSADKLKNLVIQVSGLDEGSSTVGAIVGSFNALDKYADHDSEIPAGADTRSENSRADTSDADRGSGAAGSLGGPLGGIRLGYTINLNLPATSDIAVFDAIFKSLRENLLKP